jgi:CRP-like cAMP-binding protein
VHERRIFSYLRPELQNKIRSVMHPRYLPRGAVISHSNRSLTHTCFIEEGLACGTWTGTGRAPIDILLIGPHDFVGFPLLFGLKATPYKFSMMTAGTILQIDASVFHKLLEEDRVLRSRFLRYAAYIMLVLSQTASCNALHTVQARLPNLLLRCSDRLGSNELPISHDALSHLLGVRRSSVSDAIHRIVAKGGLVLGHRHLKIIDRDVLLADGCDCYATLRNLANTTLGYS